MIVKWDLSSRERANWSWLYFVETRFRRQPPILMGRPRWLRPGAVVYPACVGGGWSNQSPLLTKSWEGIWKSTWQHWHEKLFIMRNPDKIIQYCTDWHEPHANTKPHLRWKWGKKTSPDINFLRYNLFFILPPFQWNLYVSHLLCTIPWPVQTGKFTGKTGLDRSSYCGQ